MPWEKIRAIVDSIVAPVLTAFVAWVLADARRRRIKKLYFVSRDGQILLLIASELRRDGDPECQYLYGSRQAWFLPSTQTLDEDSLHWAWMNTVSRTGIDILRCLEINDEQILTILAQEGFSKETLDRSFDDKELQRFKKLIRTEPIASILLKKVKDRRKLLLEYLSQEGCFDGESWALVDIGWELNCQKALNQILKSIDFAQTLTGYYFGVSHRHMPLSQVGNAYPFIAHTSTALRSPCRGNWLFKRPTIVVVENIFVVSNHESVCAYYREKQCIEPVYVDEENKEWRISLAKAIHSSVRAYAGKLAEGSRLMDVTSPGFRKRALSEMKRFCLYPRASEVQPIAVLPVNSDQTHGKDHWENLASSISMQSLFQIMQAQFHFKTVENSPPAFFWLAGSAAISSWPVRAIILSGSALMRALDSLRFFFKGFLKQTKEKE